jgi:hypothetical protein
MLFDAVNPVINTFLRSLITYLPNFFGGLLVFAIGLVLAEILRKILVSLFNFLKLELLIKKTKLANEKEVKIWEEILAELLRWSVVILFLIPAAEVWGLSKVTVVLNQLLFYLPNVLVAVVIGFIGLIFANLVSDLVKHSVKTLGATSANTLAALARFSIVFFTVLIVMHQLGIAQDLIRILFTGIVAMLALAGGLSFGLGGKDIAKEMLEEFRKKL